MTDLETFRRPCRRATRPAGPGRARAPAFLARRTPARSWPGAGGCAVAGGLRRSAAISAWPRPRVTGLSQLGHPVPSPSSACDASATRDPGDAAGVGEPGRLGSSLRGSGAPVREPAFDGVRIQAGSCPAPPRDHGPAGPSAGPGWIPRGRSGRDRLPGHLGRVPRGGSVLQGGSPAAGDAGVRPPRGASSRRSTAREGGRRVGARPGPLEQTDLAHRHLLVHPGALPQDLASPTTPQATASSASDAILGQARPLRSRPWPGPPRFPRGRSGGPVERTSATAPIRQGTLDPDHRQEHPRRYDEIQGSVPGASCPQTVHRPFPDKYQDAATKSSPARRLHLQRCVNRRQLIIEGEPASHRRTSSSTITCSPAGADPGCGHPGRRRRRTTMRPSCAAGASAWTRIGQALAEVQAGGLGSGLLDRI